MLQTTKPDTIGASLIDSPVGLAAYVLEKYSTWVNPEFRHLPDGGLTKSLTLDELLTNIMVRILLKISIMDKSVRKILN